jgi:hypothetical protein
MGTLEVDSVNAFPCFTTSLNAGVSPLYGFRGGVNSAIERRARVTLPPYFARRQPGTNLGRRGQACAGLWGVR